MWKVDIKRVDVEGRQRESRCRREKEKVGVEETKRESRCGREI